MIAARKKPPVPWMLADDDHINLWSLSAPAAPETGVLEQAVSADVVVLGAGYTGLSTALHLAEYGLEAVVLEACGIGHGGSGRNVGLVNAGMWLRPDDLIARLGEDRGRMLLEALGGAPGEVFSLIERFGIACEAERQGTLHMAVGAAGFAELGERQRQWQALGAPVRRLDRMEAARLSGTSAFSGALLDRRAGTVQPLAYARGLARAAQSLGAAIYTSSPAVSATRAGDLWTVSTPKGRVTAPRVVVATNAYSGLVPGFPFAAQQRELTLLPFFQVATAPLPPEAAARILPERQGCWDTRLVMTAFRMDGQGRLIFGSVGALEPVSRAAQQAFAARGLRKLFPFLDRIAFEAFWHGQIGLTRESLPRFHRFAPGVIGVNGFNGRGIAPGTVFGKAMARLIAFDEAMMLPETPVGSAPLAAVKTTFYKLGSHLAHLFAARM